MAKKSKTSIEEQIEDWCKNQLQNVRFFTKTESINPDIESALQRAPSKKGGTGTNYPDIKLLVSNSELRIIPVMIEVKGTKGDFIKADANGNILNTDAKGEPNYTNIARFAVNGAIHYGNAILNYSNSYDEVIAIGVNGYDTPTKRIYELGVYYVSKSNLFIPKKIGEFSDLSFLTPAHLQILFDKINLLSLSESEIEAKKQDLEDDIERKLKAINQRMKDELEIVVGARVQLITGLVMAGLGVKDKVSPLRISELTGETGTRSNDGVRIMNKISDYLAAKNLPQEKISMIEDVLNVVFLHSKLEIPVNGESKLKTLYTDVRNNILPFLTGELHNIDFTGRLFNVLNDWVDVPDGDKNDVVLTPRYVTELMASLCNVNRESYVWDFATGSGGFLISAMHQMIADAKKHITSETDLEEKILHIKMQQLMGIEKLPDIYMLAVLNMILMKDGSTNLIHGDSLRNFEGLYEQGDLKGTPFPANVFLLNPPYSADGKGMIFVEKALGLMKHGGMAAILIQENAGRGQGLPFSSNILANNTLLASIKMSDIFCGKASVSTAIYVFQVGTPHQEKSIVKFIDFSNDGYQRQNRKKSSQRVNLRDVDNAKERYAEVIRLVKFGRGRDNENLHYYKDAYIEDYITLSGADWTYRQHKPVDNRPSQFDFISVIQNFTKWIVSTILDIPSINYEGLKFSTLELSEDESRALSLINAQSISYNNFRIGKFFDIRPTKSYGLTNDKLYAQLGDVPVVCNSSVDNGIGGFIALQSKERGMMITYSDTTTSDAIFYQPFDFVGYSHVQGLYPIKDIEEWDENTLLYLVACFRKAAFGLFDYADKFNREIASDMKVSLPVLPDNNECVNYSLMRNYITAVKKQVLKNYSVSYTSKSKRLNIMDEENISLASKAYMRRLVAQTNEYPSLFKYCSFDGGVKMLSAMNLQFTRADSLNDEDELNLSKCYLEPHIKLLRDAGISDDIISAKLADAQAFFSGIGICSCGKSAHNDKLWKDYASMDECEDGICIEINQKIVIDHLLAKGIKVMALLVHYFDNVSKILPWDLFLGNTLEKQIFLQLLYTSKLRSKWADEDEVRLIYSKPFSGTHFRPQLNPKCINAVFYGRDMSQSQRIKVGQILNRYRHIKRIMTH